MSHPLRLAIIEQLQDGREASPNEMRKQLGVPLTNISYHVRFLAELGVIEEVRNEPRRGAVEHFYVLAHEIRVTTRPLPRGRRDAVKVADA